MVKLNEIEIKVLHELAQAERQECCMYFRGIVSNTKLELKQVRRACRSLARKKLAEYVRGLMDEDGQVAGSGYTATQAGVDRAEIEDMVFTTPEAKEAALRGVITTPLFDLTT